MFREKVGHLSTMNGREKTESTNMHVCVCSIGDTKLILELIEK